MLTAINKLTNQSIYYQDYVDNLLDYKDIELVDPIFHRFKVFARRSHFRTRNNNNFFVTGHFVLKLEDFDLPNDIYYDPDYFGIRKDKFFIKESWSHINAKLLIAEQMKKTLCAFENIKITFETPVFIDVLKKRKIADVMIHHQSGQLTAIEVQISPISLHTLNEITYGYQSEGIDVLWAFGEKSCSDENTQFVYENCINPSFFIREIECSKPII
jgi:hypothetical protein